MEYSWGGFVVKYPLTAEGKKAFEAQMWRFIEYLAGYSLIAINEMLVQFQPQLDEFPR